MNSLDRVEQLAKFIRIYSNESFTYSQTNRLKIEDASELLRQVAESLVKKKDVEDEL